MRIYIEHVSVNKKVVLPESLHNFTAEAEMRRNTYFEAVSRNQNPNIDKLCITKDESERKSAFGSKSIIDMQWEIYRKIEELPDAQVQEELFNKLVKGKKTRAAYEEFYRFLSEDV